MVGIDQEGLGSMALLDDSLAGLSPSLKKVKFRVPGDDGCTDPGSHPFREAKAAAAVEMEATPTPTTLHRQLPTSPTTPQKKDLDLKQQMEEEPLADFHKLLKLSDYDYDDWADPEGWGCTCTCSPFGEAMAAAELSAAAEMTVKVKATRISPSILLPPPPTAPARRPRRLPRSVVTNSTSMTTPQKKELDLREVEAVDTEDVEVVLRAIKPSLISSPLGDGSISEERRNGVSSSRSPSSQFEYDIMVAPHQTLDFDSLRKNCFLSLLDEDKPNLSEQPSDEVSIHNKAKDYECSKFVQDMLSPMEVEYATDDLWYRLECSFPDMVQDVSEILSNDLHNLIFPVEEEEAGALIPLPLNDKAGDNEEVVHLKYVSPGKEAGTGEEVAGNQNQGEGGVGLHEQEEDEEDQFGNASYSPWVVFVLKKDVRLPELSSEDSSTTSTLSSSPIRSRQRDRHCGLY
jgi:hypothetical protein